MRGPCAAEPADDHIVVAVSVHLHRRCIRGSPQKTIKHGDIMRRLFAVVSKRAVSLSGVCVGASLISLATPFEASALPAGTLHGPVCGVELAFVFGPNRTLHGDMSCPDRPAP